MGGQAIHLLDHAVERYQERVRPGLSVPDVKLELTRVLPLATFQTERPPQVSHAHDDTGAWLVVVDSIVFPLVASDADEDWFAPTCVTVCGVGTEVRAAKNKGNAARRYARGITRKKWVQRKQAKRNGRPDRGPRIDREAA